MKWTIFKRLTFGYVLVLVLVVFLGIYSTMKLKQINRLIITIDTIDVGTIRLAEQLSDSLFSQVGFGKKYLVSGDHDFYRQFQEIEDHIREDFVNLSQLMSSTEKSENLFDAKRLYNRYVSLFTAEVGRIGKVKRETGVIGENHQSEKDTIVNAMIGKLKGIIRLSRLDRDRRLDQSNEFSSRVLKVTTISIGLTILTGVLISYLNTRSINRPVLRLQEKTKEIARGKFEEIGNIASPPEIRELADHFNAMCRRLKELEEMKIDFISHLSHQLSTPLTAIREASSMLLDQVYADSPEKERELLVITQEECERLIGSVNRILDLSRMEAKMTSFHLRESSLEPLVEKCVTKIMPIAHANKIKLDVQVSPNLPMVNIDETQLELVFENILGNALKFTVGDNDNRVTIDISVPPGELDFIQISVSDTGPGISADNLENIFDKFQRIENGIETVRGAGLGLPIVKHIITAHRGRIWVESKPGEGSTFHFTLPVFSESC